MKLSRQHAQTASAFPRPALVQRQVPSPESLIANSQRPAVLAASQAPVTQRQGAAPDPRSGGFNGQPRVSMPPASPSIARAVAGAGSFTVNTTPAQIYGCCGLWDLCGDADLMSLSFAGQEPFLDWIGWEPTSVCRIQKNFVTWARPEYSGESATAGYVASACLDGNSVEWGDCDFILTDFGRLRRVTPVRDLTRTGLRLCEAQPRYRLDGTPITDDAEFDMRIVTEVLFQDLKRLIVTGNDATPGQFDGLEVLVNTGYVNSSGRRCSSMDSNVIDWNANDFDGGAGITWNGTAVGATYGFVDALIAAFRRTRQRIAWAPTLAAQRLAVGDIVFVAPTHVNACLLDAYTCWSVCPGQQYREANLNTFDARSFRDNLNGGMFGAGRIFIDGFEIPLINYDWGLIKGATRSDAYLLTGHVGNQRIINGQYNDMRVAAQQLPNWYDVTDGGRLLTYVDTDNTCFARTVEMDPRLLLWGPFLQTRFTDVVCRQLNSLLSPDPLETSFFPETSFSIAACTP